MNFAYFIPNVFEKLLPYFCDKCNEHLLFFSAQNVEDSYIAISVGNK